MTTIASPTNAARPTRGRRLAAATLFAAGIAAGALLNPAIAGAAPPVTPTPHPVIVVPGAPVTPNLPPGTGPGETGGAWDIERYDECIALHYGEKDCCDWSGGDWVNGKCQAPPGLNAQ